MMKASLLDLINIEGSKSFFSSAEHIAESHSANGYNISPELYDYWLDSLMEVVLAFDRDFDEEVDLAWRMIMAPGISFMKYYYDKEMFFPKPEKQDGHDVGSSRLIP